MTDTLTLIRPDDWHIHFRDGAAMHSVLPDTARVFARAIAMPNLKPPVLTLADAAAYRGRLLQAARGTAFQPLMTLYLTDNTRREDILAAQASGIVQAVKYYPAGATTNSDSGVTDIAKAAKAIAALEECGMPLLLHGEVTDADVDVFDREAVFIERHLVPLLRDFPRLKLVLEHITTRRAAESMATHRTGRIVNISSVSAQRGGGPYSKTPYSVPTAAVHHHRAPPAVQPQRPVPGRHPAAYVLPAGAQARTAPCGAGGGRH